MNYKIHKYRGFLATASNYYIMTMVDDEERRKTTTTKLGRFFSITFTLLLHSAIFCFFIYLQQENIRM